MIPAHRADRRLRRRARSGQTRGVCRWTTLLAPVALTACGFSLPSEWKVEDLRVLDVRVDPAEIPLFEPGALTLDPAALPPVARTRVSLTALVAHPDLDAATTLTWARCTPGLASYPCAGAIAPLAPSGTASTSFVPVDVLLADLAASGGGPEALIAGIVEDPRDLLNGLYANVVLRAAVERAAIPVDTPALDARKRIVVFEPRVVARTVEEARTQSSTITSLLGELPTLCTQLDDAGLAAVFAFLRARPANRAPVLRAVGVAQVDTPTVGLALGATLRLRRGEEVALWSELNEDVAEPYQQLDTDCRVVDFEEAVATSWFVAHGEVSRQLTTADEPTLVYTAPVEAERTRDRIWVVVRDGRGSSAHGWIDVELLP